MRSRPPRSRFHPADRAPAVIDVDLTAERSSPPQPPACRQVRGDRAAGRQEQQQPWKRPYPHNTQGRQNESDSAGRREPAPRRNRPICVGDSLAAAPAISQTLLEWLQCLSPATELAVDKALLERHERLLSPSPHAGERDSSDGHDERRLTADSVGHLLAPGASSPCCRGGAPRSLLKSLHDRCGHPRRMKCSRWLSVRSSVSACNPECVEESDARALGDQGLSLRARTPASASPGPPRQPPIRTWEVT